MDDFYKWANEQAQAIENDWLFDHQKVADEIRALARREVRSLESYLERLIEHMIKLNYLKADDYRLVENRRGWQQSVVNARRGIQKLLKSSPSLQVALEGFALVEMIESQQDMLVMDGYVELVDLKIDFTLAELLEED